MANTRNTDQMTWNVKIVDPATGFPTPEFLRKFNGQRNLNEGLAQVIGLLDVNILAGTGLTGGGLLGDLTDITLTLDDEYVEDLVGTMLVDTADVTLTYTDATGEISADLTPTGVAAGTYGDATNVPQITVDANGRVTDVVDVPITGGGGSSMKYMGLSRMSGNDSVSTTFSASFWGGRFIVADKDATITKLLFWATQAAPTADIVVAIYSDNAGLVDALIATSSTVNGATAGLNEITLTTPLVLNEGDAVWAGIQITNAGIRMASSDGIGGAYFFDGTLTPPNPASAATYTSAGSQTWSSMWLSE